MIEDKGKRFCGSMKHKGLGIGSSSSKPFVIHFVDLLQMIPHVKRGQITDSRR